LRAALAPASHSEAAAEAERVVAWLRLPAIGLLALGEGIDHPNRNETGFLIALAVFSAWSLGMLVWVHLRPASTRLALLATVVDIALISVLAVLSGGAFSHARLAFFLIPVAVAFRFRPSVTAAAAVASTLAYVVQAVAHPARGVTGATRFIATQAGFLAWVGLACAALSLLLARRTRLLAANADERSRLLADALDAEQRERQLLAEALHDEALQNLLSARHELAEAAEEVDHPALERADGAVAATVGQLRDAVFELHPYVLEQAGLQAALRSIAQQTAVRGGLELTLDLRYPDRNAHDALLFSAAREVLSNVVRHAHAKHLTVRLAQVEDEVALAVADDGQGFPVERLAESLANGHVGLASQRVRIEAAGGRLEVTSAAGEGTRVAIRLPAAPVAGSV
jgi:two-component system NarL family sensor kinase